MEKLNPRERLKQLTELVPHLTLNEVRQLRALLAEVDLRTDILSRMPLELKICVVEYLDVPDITNCIYVAKKWTDIFLKGDLTTFAASHCFPGLVECAEAAGKDVAGEFREALMKQKMRSLGRFQSALFNRQWLQSEDMFRLDSSLHPISHHGADYRRNYQQLITHFPGGEHGEGEVYPSGQGGIRYAHGRLAWMPVNAAPPDNSLVVVDNLWSHTRKVFRYPGEVPVVLQGGTMRLLHLGDKLVVTMLGRRFIAWDLDTGEVDEIQLPQVDWNIVAYTHGRSVWIVQPLSNSLAHWRFRHGVISVSLVPLGTSFGPSTAVDLISHPLQQDVVFLVLVCFEEAEQDTIVNIHEFTGIELRQSFVFNVSSIPGVTQKSTQAFIRARNSYGLFTVVLVSGEGSASYDIRHTGPALTSINFNVWTRTFSYQEHHDREMKRTFRAYRPDFAIRSHFWNDQRMYFDYLEGMGRVDERDDERRLVVRFYNPCAGGEHEMEKQEIIAGMQRRYRLTRDEVCGASHSLALDILIEHDHEEGAHCAVRFHAGQIIGDDDFVVVHGTEGYAIWALDSELPSSRNQISMPCEGEMSRADMIAAAWDDNRGDWVGDAWFA